MVDRTGGIQLYMLTAQGLTPDDLFLRTQQQLQQQLLLPSSLFGAGPAAAAAAVAGMVLTIERCPTSRHLTSRSDCRRVIPLLQSRTISDFGAPVPLPDPGG